MAAQAFLLIASFLGGLLLLARPLEQYWQG